MASQVWQDRDTLQGVIEAFPSEYDRARIANYLTNRLIRHGHHEEVFPLVQRELDAGALANEQKKWAGLTYVPVNVCGQLSKANAEDLFLDPPALSFGTDEQANALATAWTEVAERSSWHAMVMDEIDGASVNGDAAFKLYVRDGTGVVIDPVDISLVFRGEDYAPEYAAAQPDRRITRYPLVATPIKHGEEWYVLLEVHEPGRVVYRAYRWLVSCPPERDPSFADEGELAERVELDAIGVTFADYEEPALSDPSLLIVHNDHGEHAFWGASDYTRDVKAHQDSINHLFSILIEHGDRLIKGGIAVLPEEMRADVTTAAVSLGGTTGKDYGRRSIAGGSTATMVLPDVVFEHAQNLGLSRFISIAPQYEGAMKVLEGVWATFERLTGLTLDPLFTHAKAPESGRAMRLARYRDNRRIARRQIRWQEAVTKLPQMALALLGVQIPRPSVTWADSVKLSDQEKAEIIVARTAGKATLSIESALERYDGLTQEQSQAEAKRIEDDGAMARVSSPALFSERGQFADETTRAPGEQRATEPTATPEPKAGA